MSATPNRLLDPTPLHQGQHLIDLAVDLLAERYGLQPVIGAGSWVRPVTDKDFRPIPAASFEEIIANASDEPEYVVENYIPVHGESFCVARPSMGKSHIAIDQALSVAGAFDSWHGLSVQHGPAVYIAGERADEVEKRIRAYHRAYGFSSLPFHLIKRPIDFGDSEDVDAFVGEVSKRFAHVQLVVVDTLSRCCPGSENDDDVAKRFMSGIARSREKLGGPAHLILAHPSKNAKSPMSRIPAASRVFWGAADTIFDVGKGRGKVHPLTVHPSKTARGSGFPGSTFTTREIDLGIDRNGKPIRSLILCHQTPPKPAMRRDSDTEEGEDANETTASGHHPQDKPTTTPLPETVFGPKELPAFRALQSLGKNDSTTRGEIAAQAACDRRTVGRMLTKAEQHGWSTSSSGRGVRDDAKQLTLTDTGREV